MIKNDSFLELLQKEASLQAELEKKPIFPRKIGFALSLIAQHSWKFILTLSFLTAILLNLK